MNTRELLNPHREYTRSVQAERSWQPTFNLSPHEVRLLSLLGDGHNITRAATMLGVSRATVAWHMGNIYGKLQVHSKVEAVVKALRLGLID